MIQPLKDVHSLVHFSPKIINAGSTVTVFFKVPKTERGKKNLGMLQVQRTAAEPGGLLPFSARSRRHHIEAPN